MTFEELKETADLARLNMDESELTAAFGAFEQMLGFFALMQTADKDPSFTLPEMPGNSQREIQVLTNLGAGSGNNPSSGLNEKLLNNAGERDGRFIVIPGVL